MKSGYHHMKKKGATTVYRAFHFIWYWGEYLEEYLECESSSKNKAFPLVTLSQFSPGVG